MVLNRTISCLIVHLGLLLLPMLCHAEESSQRGTPTTGFASLENVTTLALRGDYYRALINFDATAEENRSNADKLSAAKASWALGLVARARTLWDEVLASRELDPLERSRILLSRGILELQEANYEEARAFAEEGARKLPSSDLRSQFWLLIGDSLKEQGILSAALPYYEKASVEASPQSRAETSYLYGECQASLGQLSQARYSFTNIPVASIHAGKGLRKLVEIDFQDRDYEATLTWLKEGMQSYPTEFDEPWFSYVHVVSLLESHQSAEAELALAAFKAKHSEQNSWYQLAESALVSHKFRSSLPQESQTATPNNPSSTEDVR